MTSPAQHWEVFEQIYNSYEDVFQPLNDNIPIIVEIGRRNLLHSIDARFNVLFGLELFEHYPFLLFPLRESEQLLRLAATSVYLRSFFLHFAGSFSYAPYVNSAVATWLDLVTLGLPDKLMFPNREVASQRFLPDTSQAPKALAQVCAKPPLPSLNYFDRYRTLPGGAQPLSDQQTILFDETLSCVGFRGPEKTTKGTPLQWTGFDSSAALLVERCSSELSNFKFMVLHEGGPRLAEGVRITVNDVDIYPLRIVGLSKIADSQGREESFAICGSLPRHVGSSLLFRIFHPYLTAVRDDSPDRRRLGLAITRLVLEKDPTS